MPWPSMSDYREAIQNPKSCFADPQLKNGIPATDKLGLPRPVTGNFASVYEMTCGGRKFAVRCFLRNFPDLERRYSMIGYYLDLLHLKYMVDFEFINRGIMIKGQWFPILKMEWIDGEQLNTYVARNLSNPQALQSLAEQFCQMVADLRRCSIAHGDLQHGNILVLNANLRLIDYDGMYVPGLKGMQSHELGHENYQHPKRTFNDFGPDLDNFSAWIIYASLFLLSINPALWKIAGPDESLLFRSSDFRYPATSSIIANLDRNSDNRIRPLVAALKTVFFSPELTRVPSLEPPQSMDVSPQTRSALPPRTLADPSGSPKGIDGRTGLPDWLSSNPPKSTPGLIPDPAHLRPADTSLSGTSTISALWYRFKVLITTGIRTVFASSQSGITELVQMIDGYFRILAAIFLGLGSAVVYAAILGNVVFPFVLAELGNFLETTLGIKGATSFLPTAGPTMALFIGIIVGLRIALNWYRRVRTF